MTRISFVVVATILVGIALPSRAYAIDRNCPKGQVWSITLGTCVKKKPAPKLSPQEKFDRANDDLEGRGVRPDPKRGVKLLAEGCSANHGASCTLLGYLNQRGRSGVVRDDAKAMEFFVRGCKLNDVEGCYLIGDTAFRIAEYPAARAAFERACSLGSGSACVRMADLVDRGVGGAKDSAVALQLYKRALEILAPKCPGAGDSCFVLGLLYEDGRGVAKDPKKAIDAFRNGCNATSGDSCTRLAAMLETQKDLDGANDALEKSCNRYDNAIACRKLAERLGIAKKQLDRAFALAKRGCALDQETCGTLGELYRLGFGVTADQTEATRQYKLACESGIAWCDTYGQRAHDGAGMQRDDAIALAAFERGCKGGEASSCHFGIKLLIETKTDDARGFTLGTMGCDYKNGNACYLAGWMTASGRAGGPASPERAFALYDKGCTLGAPVACNALAEAHRAGSGVEKDPAKASAKFEEACKGNPKELYANACKTWGVMAYFGETGTKDLATATTAFRRACQYGEPDTCAYLATVAVEAGGKALDEAPVVEKACAGGFEHACIALGDLYAASESETNRRKAYDAFVASCSRKHEPGCVRQADLLSTGFGITKDVAKAEQIYRTRCDAGSAQACFGMGRLLAAQKKYDESLTVTTRACESGVADACSSVGFAYYTALGTRWDVAQAAKFFAKSCELGSSVGCANTADVYRYGIGAPRDHAKAFELYTKSCTPTDPAGCAGVGHYVATGEGGIAVDRKAAERSLRAACTSSIYVLADACSDLADLLEAMNKGSAGEIARLRTTAFSRAKEQANDNPYYAYVLGTFYIDGVATMKDPVVALEWFAKACDGFDPLGCIAAGKALGATAQPADAERARVYFERACAAGVDDGCALGKIAPPKPPTTKAKGCGCSGEIAGGDAGAALLVLLVLARRRRRS